MILINLYGVLELFQNINKLIKKNRINSLYGILNKLFDTSKTGLQFSKYFELFIQDLLEMKKIDENTKNDIISNKSSIKELVTAKYQNSPRSIFNDTIHNIYNIFESEKILNIWVENIKKYIHFYNWFLTKIGWLQEKK